METSIINQIQILQELKNKCLEISGYYGDIDIAVAALQICSTFGIDNTARLLGILKQNQIKTDEDLLNIINNSTLNNAQRVIENEFGDILCPKCNTKLETKVKHCNECGQRLNFDNIYKKKPILFEENNESI